MIVCFLEPPLHEASNVIVVLDFRILATVSERGPILASSPQIGLDINNGLVCIFTTENNAEFILVLICAGIVV